MPKKKETKTHPCHFCGVQVTEDDFCYGCNHYVCANCDETYAFGDHKVEDHKGNDGDFDFDA